MCTGKTPSSYKFLDAVAKYLLRDLTALAGSCVVFPNKRSGIFFRRALKRHVDSSFIMPTIMTIGSFEAHYCEDDVVTDDRLELLMILYDAYCSVMTRHERAPMSFDRFAFWGDMMLNDFSDIDRSLANPDELYTNLVRYDEIASNYLTPEQLEILSEVWDDERIQALRPSDTDSFWRHVSAASEANEGGDYAQRFMHLWEVSGQTYTEFVKRLKKNRIIHGGLVERRLCERFKKMSDDDFGFARFVFVGFSNISLAQATMFRELQKRHRAIFFWDVLPDAETAPYAARASRLIRNFEKNFTMPVDFDLPAFTSPEVRVMAVPSKSLQSKAASITLSEWHDKDYIHSFRPDNTAVVLPDSSLLPGLLHSLPKTLEGVNITMGLSYRHTPFASLLRAIIGMHLRRRMISGSLFFFHEDVTNVLTHPHLRAIDEAGCSAAMDYILRSRQYYIDSTSLFEATESVIFRILFADVNPLDPVAVRGYLKGIINTIGDALSDLPGTLNTRAHEVKVLRAYSDAVDRIFDGLLRHNIMSVGEATLFGMVEKVLGVATLNMSGTPLSGVQIMGVLETRAIDFDNVIVMSMNERVFPRRRHMRSLIPQQLRRAFGLPVSDDEDTEYAYHFYHLLNRSHRVLCLYDSRAAGLSSGAPSRFLMQLKYLHGDIRLRWGNYIGEAEPGGERPILVYKDDYVQRELARFKAEDDDRRNLSASALKCYRKCGLRFYLDYVRGVRSDNDPVPYMDSATYGTVLHRVLEELFEECRPKDSKSPVQITRDILVRMIADSDSLLQRVYRHVDVVHHRERYKGRYDMLPGDSMLLAEMMRDFIVKVIEKEIKAVDANGPFEFVEGEKLLLSGFNGTGQWQITPTNSVNVRLEIDRVDRLAPGVLRFIDYKTGHDSPDIASVEGMFTEVDRTSNDAIFQLLFYANAYADLTHFKGTIVPALYRLRAAFAPTGKFDDDSVKIDTHTIVWSNMGSDAPVAPGVSFNADMAKHIAEYRERLNAMIDSIFDVDRPFEQTADRANCKFCPYTLLCRRVVPQEDF